MGTFENAVQAANKHTENENAASSISEEYDELVKLYSTSLLCDSDAINVTLTLIPPEGCGYEIYARYGYEVKIKIDYENSTTQEVSAPVFFFSENAENYTPELAIFKSLTDMLWIFTSVTGFFPNPTYVPFYDAVSNLNKIVLTYFLKMILLGGSVVEKIDNSSVAIYNPWYSLPAKIVNHSLPADITTLISDKDLALLAIQNALANFGRDDGESEVDESFTIYAAASVLNDIERSDAYIVNGTKIEPPQITDQQFWNVIGIADNQTMIIPATEASGEITNKHVAATVDVLQNILKELTAVVPRKEYQTFMPIGHAYMEVVNLLARSAFADIQKIALSCMCGIVETSYCFQPSFIPSGGGISVPAGGIGLSNIDIFDVRLVENIKADHEDNSFGVGETPLAKAAYQILSFCNEHNGPVSSDPETPGGVGPTTWTNDPTGGSPNIFIQSYTQPSHHNFRLSDDVTCTPITITSTDNGTPEGDNQYIIDPSGAHKEDRFSKQVITMFDDIIALNHYANLKRQDGLKDTLANNMDSIWKQTVSDQQVAPALPWHLVKYVAHDAWNPE